MATRKRTTNGVSVSKRGGKVNLAAAENGGEARNELWMKALKLLLRDLIDGDVEKVFDESDSFVRLVRYGASVRDICAATGAPRNQVVAQLVALARV